MARPNDNQRYQQAVVLARRGDLHGARTLLEDLVKRHPTQAALHLALGDVQKNLGELADASRTLGKAVALDPALIPARFALASVLSLEGDLDEAHAHMRRVLDAQPEDPQAVAVLADILFAQGRYAEADDALRPFLDRHPVAPSVALAFGRLAHRVDRIDDAVAVLSEMVEDGRGDDVARRRALFWIGGLLERQARYDDAFDAFERANAMMTLRFDADEFTTWVDRTIETWSAAAIERLGTTSERSERPLFIVGMPRSGTSLVEQIL
ncbi:MAG: tetratricopeptide repeat protein, partial [Phycisphaerales bacterium]|nr:tetratricopeptide repeat protein [Phycisphaerales bacterium]